MLKNRMYLFLILCLILSAIPACSPEAYNSQSVEQSDKLLPYVEYDWFGREKWGFIDEKGKVRIKCKYDHVNEFSEGLAVVSLNEKMGYIDAKGSIKYPIQASGASDFSEGRGRVIFGIIGSITYSGYINYNGEIVINPEYEDASDFREGLTCVCKNNKFGYIDKEGNTVIPFQYDRSYNFSEGLAMVDVAGKRGYIDKSGAFVIQPKFEDAKDFSEGIALVSENNDRYYIDSKGNRLTCLDNKYAKSGSFHEGYAIIRDGKYLFGYMNNQGTIIIEPNLSYANDYYEGLASASAWVDGIEKWGYINKNGEWAIAPQFDEANNFENGIAPVYIEKKVNNEKSRTVMRYITPEGEFLFPLVDRTLFYLPKKEYIY